MELDKQFSKFEEFSGKQDSRYVSAVMAAFTFFKESGSTHPAGNFSSSDGTLVIVADPEGASCTYKLGEGSYEGRLPRKPLCYEGALSTGGGLIRQSRQVLVLQVGEDTLRAIVWPDVTVSMDPLRVLDVSRVHPQPQLALPRDHTSDADQSSVPGTTAGN